MNHNLLCKLCEQQPAIKNSHPIPSFSIRWIKETSATGYLRQGIRPNVPVQDIQKHPLLCTVCEGEFSKFEKEFAEKIFVPFQNGEKNFHYEDWMLYFAVSLAWRTTIIHIEECKEQLNPELVCSAYIAIEFWRKFLMRESSDPGPYSHHLLFLGVISDAEEVSVPKEMHRYLLRCVDATIAAGQKYIFAYTKIPGMIFWSGINPTEVPGWHGTKINKSGNIGFPQAVEQPGWGDFLVKRVNEVIGMLSQMSDAQVERIQKKLESNPARAMSSRTFEAVEADDYWDERQGRK